MQSSTSWAVTSPWNRFISTQCCINRMQSSYVQSLETCCNWLAKSSSLITNQTIKNFKNMMFNIYDHILENISIVFCFVIKMFVPVRAVRRPYRKQKNTITKTQKNNFLILFWNLFSLCLVVYYNIFCWKKEVLAK